MPFEALPLNEDTLTALLNEGAERAGLDYKESCDLNDTFELVSIVKDAGAMQIPGGYLVVGADDGGQPSGKVTAAQAKLFDQATVQSKFARYLPDGFDIRSTGIEVDGNWFGVICVLPHPNGIAPFKTTGNAVHPQSQKPVVLFRAGEVFTRRGSKSEPWALEDVRSISEEIRRQEREKAREEYGQLLAQATGSDQGKEGPAAESINWQMDADTLVTIVTRQIRGGDDIPVTQLLKRAPRDAAEHAVAGDSDAFDAILDGLVCLAATMMTVNRDQLAERAVEALGAIYDVATDQQGMDRPNLGISPPELRLRVIGRAWGLGALATRERNLQLIRQLAGYCPAVQNPDYWQNWLFHGVVMAARAGLLEDPNNRSGKSPIVIGQEHVVRLECLRPDLAADDERIVTSLCQFDLLADLASLSLSDAKHKEAFFPNFARWYASRSDPAARMVIDKNDARDVIFAGGSDQELADALRAIAALAGKMSGAIHGWHGYEDQRIHRFLQEHPPQQ